MSTLVALPMDHHHPSARRHKKMLRDGSGEVWPDHAEVLFSRAIADYDRQSALSSHTNSPYPPDLPSRNEFIVRYLKERGLERSKQQVASHIQQLKKRTSKELGGSGGGGSSNGSSPVASPSTLAAPAWVDPYTGIASAPPHTPTQPFYNQQQQYATGPTSPSYHRPAAALSSPSATSSASRFVPSSTSSSPHSLPPSPPSHSGPITSLQIRINNRESIHVPLTPSSSASGPISVTTLSATSLKIRLLVPPHSSPLAHLQNANIYAIAGLRSDVYQRLTGMMLGNRIWADGRLLGEETDMFQVKPTSSGGVQIVAPLRVNGSMLMGQNIGALTVTQTIYGPPSNSSYSSSGATTTLLSINYEFVHAAHPALPPQQQHAQQQLSMNGYGGGGMGGGYSNQPIALGNAWTSSGASSGPFTQF